KKISVINGHEVYRRWTVSHHLRAQPNFLKNPCYSPRMRYASTESLGLSSRLYLYEEANRSSNGKDKVKNCEPHEHQISWRLSHPAIPIYRFHTGFIPILFAAFGFR